MATFVLEKSAFTITLFPFSFSVG